ncbi:Secretory pathway Sec39 [Corchorus capsularis]|uniref:Secretory pathway Sec39 n=1 Tax=Corchorus capsularis TaxID=210143 RepID=A0A1R3IZ85_COCAP|nr:Secretory pathway Sec39 [Corchorus capsularis]
MEESVREVLYEERRHASRPFTSNYPPLPLQESNEAGKGGFLSFLSARGISQLKERWAGYKSPKKLKKPVSLFISPRGERVAVAAGNQVTILRKEDDFREPCGVFTSSSLISCTCGAWSESHDILGIVDGADIIYFIKANGEEITRITKKHLKVSSTIIGLIADDDFGVKPSFLCGFTILTSDGAFHHIEISQEPGASVSSTINSGLASKKQAPQNVFCFDYYQELSLLVVVGSAGGSSITADGKSGSCYLSLWRKQEGLILEPLSFTQFEGLYCEQKGYGGHLAYPKLVISPRGDYIAALDMNGCLHIFKLDKESCSVTNFAFQGRTNSQVTDRLFNGCTDILVDILDFTWWCDHILTIAKRSGFVTMLDILTGLKLIEDGPVYSMPVLERVQKFEGHLFLLESLSSEDRFDSSNGNRRTNHREQTSEDESNQLDVSGLHWSLISFSERSVPEMYKILIGDSKYQAALKFADRYGLDRDEVLKSQWLCSGQGINDINAFLSKIKDQVFVLSQCVDKVGTTEEAVKALLAYGLQLTNRYKFSESNDQETDKIWDFRMSRLQLLQFSDRLETFLGINMGRFSMQEYGKFRVMPIKDAAVTLAESGKIGALNLLFKRHRYSLAPFMLDILAAIPETIPVQTYVQLLPGSSPPSSIAIREEDWVECDKMVSFIKKLPENHEISTQIRTEPVVKRLLGSFWPSVDELAVWYKHRAIDIDSYSGLLDNCLCLVGFACQKGIYKLKQFHEDISYLHQLVYADESDGEISTSMSLVAWEQLSDYEKFRTMLNGCKEENVVESLLNKAIPFMQKRSQSVTLGTQEQVADGHCPADHTKSESFLVRWLKEISLANKVDVCLMVIEEGCKNLQSSGFFKDAVEVVDCALQCVYLFTVTDRWSTMAAIMSKLPHKQDSEIYIGNLDQRCKVAEGHIEAGRLLAFYQVPKPMKFFQEAHSDEKGVKQIIRLILSKFSRRQPGRSDNEWANMWRDMLCLREKAFPFLDLEYMLIEFCRGLLKAGKFSLARSYLKGTSSVALSTEKAENLVIQAAREYFFSASSLACSEIWKAKECLNLFPSSRNVKAEADIIDALTVKLPDLGVTLLPVQFRQIKDPMEIIKMAITSQTGAYLHVDEVIEVAKLLGLSSLDEISAVEEAIAREAAVAGDLQLAFDLCLVLTKKGHGHIWDLCAAIARGPSLENMDISSRKQLLGFALSHCDEESLSELLHAWKELDMQGQCETLMTLTGTNSPNFSVQGSSVISLPGYSIRDMLDLKNSSELVEGFNSADQEIHFNSIKNTLSLVAKSLPVENGTNWEQLLQENGKIFSFAAIQLPWLLELTRKSEHSKKFTSGLIPGKQYVSVRTQAVITILSWLARNGFAPRDDLLASLAKSIMEPPVTEEEDVIGCSFLLNLVDAFSGVEVIEEQLRNRENYLETCSIMNVGMTYSILHNAGVDCEDPAQRRQLLLRKFKEKNKPLNSDDINKIDEVQSSFWREWKLKLEEKKRVADHSRLVEQIIPGVETARFLSGDISYIESAVFSLIESLKLEKKHILKGVLKLADTYVLNRVEVILRYLTSILISEVWTNDDIVAEISEIKGEILGYAAETIKTISLIVYPVIDGCNKQRLAYIYSLLSDCYKQLEESKEPLSRVLPDQPNASALGLAHYYKVIEQECRRISCVKDLNFKNIAGLGGLNLQCFSSEVYAHIDEISLEALSTMVKTLVGIYSDSIPEGLISWQDVHKYYVLRLLTTLKDRVRTEFSTNNPENFQNLTSQLEQIYDLSKMHIKVLEPSQALEIIKQYFTAVIPPHGAHQNIPDNSTWQDCLIFLLNFWIRLTEEMEEFTTNEISIENSKFLPNCLMSCLKVLMRLVMEDSVSPSQGWSTIIDYVNHGLSGDLSADIFIFCRAMIFSGCGFGAISEVFVEALQHHATTATAPADTDLQDLPHLYLKVLEPILQDLASGHQEHQKLYQLISSLSNLEADLEELERVRCAVWERIARFSEDLQLASHVRVYALELMQFITGKNMKGLSSELQLNVHPWVGWDESLFASNKTRGTSNEGMPEQIDTSSRFTSTLVALKSSQLMAAISPGFEITPDDLMNVETAVSCFLKLCGVANADPHFDVLVAILEEWEGLFVIKKEEVASAVLSDAENNWGTDDWDEGWESFQEIEPLEKEKKEDDLLSVHPLHECWTEILKSLAKASRLRDVLKLIDRPITKSSGVLLDEGGARSLNDIILGADCFVASKVMLLLPYEGLQLESLSALENKLKQEGISDTIGSDHEFLMLVMSSGVLSTIINKTAYGTVFSYVCYLVGKFSHQFQEAQLSRLGKEGSNERGNKGDILFLFARILFPMFISELVKAEQQILAGFLVTKFMHTNASLGLINVAEAGLRRYLERQLHVLEHDKFAPEEVSGCETVKNTVSSLRGKLSNSLQSALSSLPRNERKWKVLTSDNMLWSKLFRERWGSDQAAFYAPAGPVDSTSWKRVYETQDRGDRVGLGLKIIREGGDYYLVHQGEIQRYLGSRRKRKDCASSSEAEMRVEESHVKMEEEEPSLGILDKILFFLGDLETASADAKRGRLLL